MSDLSPQSAGPFILVVDDEAGIRQLCCDVLRRSGFAVEAAADAAVALRRIEAGLSGQGAPVDLVLTDIKMKPVDGLRFLEALRDLSPGLRVVLMTGYPTMETAVRGMQLGARDYITKPFTPVELRALVKEALSGWRPSAPSAEGAPSGEVETLGGLVACSASMRGLLATIRRLAATEASVLITWESGTGKELVARAIHDLSRRASGAFVPVNCSALVDSLMESELFGHLKGAFTGASSRKAGLFQFADKGTLFLDEIGDLALSLQPKLLRVLQEGEIKPVGEVRSVPVDVRILAATHQDLEAGIGSGVFRQDLFYRLNVFHLRIPPLRERRDDILPIARTLLADLGQRMGRGGPMEVSQEGQRALVGHDWPGNVRELKNVLTRAATLASGEVLSEADLALGGGGRSLLASPGGYLYEGLTLDEVERRHILHHLEKFEGNRSHTARVLGINRTTLWKKLSRYGIEDDLDEPEEG